MVAYTRQSTISDGDTITAALFNDEYNQLLSAFSYASSGTTGHKHDGTAGEGGNIPQIGDQDFLNKIVTDSTNNRFGIFVQVSSSAVEQIRIQDGAIVPVTDNDIDLGTSSVEFKDAFFDGTVTTDALVADTADINGGTVDGATIGANSASTGAFTTLTASGNFTVSGTIEGTTITATTAFVPDASDGAALGTSSLEFSDLFLADAAVINFGDDQDVTLTHNADVGLTLNTKLTVTGQTELNNAVAINNNAITQTGTAPLVTMKDSNGSGTAATNEVRFTDSGDANTGGVSMVSGKTILHNNITGANGGFSIVEGTSASHADSFYMDGKKNAAASTVVNAQTNIAFSNSGTITGGGSSFSSVSAGEVIEVSGAGQAANNKEFRVISKAADVLTVRSADGSTLATESAGATVTITKGNQRVITVPNTVDMNVFTAEQTDNTQRVASTAYVRSAISNMLDSSPAALDTLNELAAAINDDANFATTINNSIATKVNRDFDNLTATGTEALNDAIGAFGGGTMTFPGTGNSIALDHDDANNQFDVTVALNDPTLGVTLTGAVTGTGTATMTDLQDTTISFSTTLASGSVGASALDTTGAVTNIINGLTRTTSVQNSDDVIISDASDGGALKKLARSLIAPPALGEDLGFFAIAMS